MFSAADYKALPVLDRINRSMVARRKGREGGEGGHGDEEEAASIIVSQFHGLDLLIYLTGIYCPGINSSRARMGPQTEWAEWVTEGEGREEGEGEAGFMNP